MNNVAVTGGFDDLRAPDLRFLEEASKLGDLTVWLWTDETLVARDGKAPKFPLAERQYFLEAVRYVHRVLAAPAPVQEDTLPVEGGGYPDVWVDRPEHSNAARVGFAHAHGIDYRVVPSGELNVFPEGKLDAAASGRKKVIVTGCYDWFHSGHVRFFEEVSAYGDVYAVVGHDANICLLKGQGHPLFPQAERRYMVGSIRYVTQALISSGEGWLDADPEIRRLQPDIYAVNQDGDKGGKREYCQKLGIEYLVLKRVPAPGLTARSSTNLRGF